MSEAAFDDILIDQGKDDEFLTQLQLLPEHLDEAAKKIGQKLTLNMREGFDHSYYFISSFIESHVAFHGKRLRKKQAEVLALASVLPDVSATAGKPIQCKAMVARGPKQPLALETITVDPPKAGEVRVKVIANALCHTVRFNLICFFFSILGYLFTLTTIMNKMKNIHSGHLHSGKLLLVILFVYIFISRAHIFHVVSMMNNSQNSGWA